MENTSAPGAEAFRTVQNTAAPGMTESGRFKTALHRVRTHFQPWKMPQHRVRTLLKWSERGLKRLQVHSDEAFNVDFSSSP
jgi:hypothetical protein